MRLLVPLLAVLRKEWHATWMDFIVAQTENRVRTALETQPVDWSLALTARTSMRMLPYISNADESWLHMHATSQFRAAFLAWMAYNYPSYTIPERSVNEATESSNVAAMTADELSNAANSCFSHAAHAVHYSSPDMAAVNLGIVMDATGTDLEPDNFFSDYEWLATHAHRGSECRVLSRTRLWLDGKPFDWRLRWNDLCRALVFEDPNYSVWIDWYERRIRGERAAFNIPGDKRRIEDKKILRRLAEATEEDFWGKGHEYVNATLKGWLDEARERAAGNLPPKVVEATGTVSAGAFSTASVERVVPIKTPPQDTGAIAYGVNEQGKLDRQPNSDQAHLRDVPDQRRAYDDLREAATALLDEGQRLGQRLKRALDRFLHSLPDGFEDAEAYLVWRDANALRRLHRAHREAAKSPEPDEARLEPVVAEGLGGLLDLYNNFAFADDGLRAKDEARVAPQERASAEAEAKAAIPLVEAILANPAIATPAALDDIVADAENAELPAGDPYTDQVLDQANRTKRNWIAGLLSFGKRALEEAGKSGKEIRSGAERAVGALIVSDLTGVTSVASPLIEFIAAHASALKDYAAIAYSSFPSLSELIDRIKALLSQLRN